MAGGMQGYQSFAAGKAMMGAGEGMAQGGGGGEGGGGNGMLGGAALGVGFGMANMFQGQAQNTGAPAAPNPAAGQLDGGGAAQAAQSSDTVVCPGCKKTVSPGKFCAECGQPLPAGPRFCSGCGAKLNDGAKFCSGCGAKTDQ
jgi:predicted nucleic acid-binding Zn ribbon protein